MITTKSLDDPGIFEDEVRRIARQIWPEAQYSGAAIREGRERDGVFETEECVHLLEATTSRKKEKAEKDIKKLAKLARKLQASRPMKAVVCWFVTKDEPTADQRGVGLKYSSLVRLVSFQQFQSKVVDARSYLSARRNYPFGSVRDPDSGDLSPAVDYVPLDIFVKNQEKAISIDDLRGQLESGVVSVLLGEYGAGKSMTLREIFNGLVGRYLGGDSSCFPAYLNLRDHWGQTDPSEALERHARKVGFSWPSHLVRAWRSGHVVLLLDGFDEMASLGIQGRWRQLVDIRRRSVALVRAFLKEHPSNVGVLIAGRDNFFQNEREIRSSLGLPRDNLLLTLSEFSSEQIASYLRRANLEGAIPDWLPSRPLLIGYLASRGVLREFGVLQEEHPLAVVERAAGWDKLIDLIAQREERIEAGIDGDTVRSILERLATRARASQSGLGPLTFEDLTNCFEDVCNYSPGEEQLTILQRLPGLGIDQAEEETRNFLDEDFADICRAGDVLKFINRGFGASKEVFRDVEICLGDLAIELLSQKLDEGAIESQGFLVAMENAARQTESEYLKADLVRLALVAGLSVKASFSITDVMIPNLELDLSRSSIQEVSFRGCLFSRIELVAPHLSSDCPVRFYGCYVGELEGFLNIKSIPGGIFDEDCLLDNVAKQAETTKSLMSLGLPLGLRVLLTILKKVFRQKGGGRRENALFRGLDHRSQRVVGDVLEVLRSSGLATPVVRRGETIWVPDRRHMGRVGRILATPDSSKDAVVRRCREL